MPTPCPSTIVAAQRVKRQNGHADQRTSRQRQPRSGSDRAWTRGLQWPIRRSFLRFEFVLSIAREWSVVVFVGTLRRRTLDVEPQDTRRTCARLRH